MKRTIVIMLLLLSALAVQAQEEYEEDSVLISGTVVNRMTGLPEPYTIVRLTQEGELRSAAWCDSTGHFGDLLLPVGGYLLEVQVLGVTLYRADLMLQQDAYLSIGVITDSIRMVNLREVRVTALRHLLGTRLIRSTDDVRLWDFSGRMDGDASARRSGDPNNPENLYGAASIFFNPGLEVGWKNSTMKNEILLYGRILDTKRPAPADTIKSSQGR